MTRINWHHRSLAANWECGNGQLGIIRRPIGNYATANWESERSWGGTDHTSCADNWPQSLVEYLRQQADRIDPDRLRNANEVANGKASVADLYLCDIGMCLVEPPMLAASSRSRYGPLPEQPASLCRGRTSHYSWAESTGGVRSSSTSANRSSAPATSFTTS